VFKTEDERQHHYTQLKTAAESGWDFSTRWYITNSTQKGKLHFINVQFSRHMSMTGDRQISLLGLVMTGLKIFSVSLMHAEIHGVWSVMYLTLILGTLNRKQRIVSVSDC